LVQSGTADNVTPQAEIEAWYRRKPGVETIFYEGAEHGFDVESLKDRRVLRPPPLVEKRYRMQYQTTVGAASFAKLVDFLLR
jgi:dienelactone hydrolase